MHLRTHLLSNLKTFLFRKMYVEAKHCLHRRNYELLWQNYFSARLPSLKFSYPTLFVGMGNLTMLGYLHAHVFLVSCGFPWVMLVYCNDCLCFYTHNLWWHFAKINIKCQKNWLLRCQYIYKRRHAYFITTTPLHKDKFHFLSAQLFEKNLLTILLQPCFSLNWTKITTGTKNVNTPSDAGIWKGA